RDVWLWRAAWHGDTMWGVGYATRDPRLVRLYRSDDGIDLRPVVATLFADGYPNESGLVFQPDGTALCLLRRDQGTATAQLGRARPPYLDWQWTDLKVQVGGPALLRLPDGRLLAGVHIPHGGTVTVAGRPLDTLPLTELRSHVALVTQEHHVFIGTLRENVAMVRPAATDADVRAALSAVAALDWAQALPDGLD
ncbi:hypothetical protein ACFQZ8_31120, partial [Micromonospora azadirachtae]